MAVGDFERDTAVSRIGLARSAEPRGGPVSYAAEVSPRWRAGRGPHGGYLAAMLTRALIETVDEPARAPRSLTIHYARAPRPGPVRIETAIERAGRSLSTLSARLEQEGALIALALAAFSIPWSGPELADGEMPSVPGPDCKRETPAELSERIEQGSAPQFLRQMVIQPRIGALPFSGAGGPMEVGAWLGIHDATRPIDAISLALFSDALFSPPFGRLRGRATSPTVDLTVHFRTRLPRPEALDPAGLCFARFSSRLVREGFFEEDGLLWAADGTLLAQSRQLAILMPLDEPPRGTARRS